MRVVGVDGCPDGRVAAAVDLDSGCLEFSVHPTFVELVAAFLDAQAIGVDIPIGLTLTRPRLADVEARRYMPGKGPSVFPAPHPDIRNESDYQVASERSRTLTGKGLSKQGFAILPKIAEVNDFLTPQHQDRIFEVHPEVSFTALNSGIPVKSRKSHVMASMSAMHCWSRNPGSAQYRCRNWPSWLLPGDG